MKLSICDQWQLVKEGWLERRRSRMWDGGRDIHFGGEPAKTLGEYLAGHIENEMKMAK